MKTKPSRKAKSRLSGYPASWLPIYNRKYPSGQQGYSVDYGLVNGKRKLRSTLDLSEAEALAEQGGISKKNEGMAAFSLSPDERTEATACIKRLQPHGVSLRHSPSLVADRFRS